MTLELTRQGAVAQITMRRAARKNAFTEAMWRTLAEHCQGIGAALAAQDRDAPRVLVLQGEAGAFCAGADIDELAALVADAAAMARNNAIIAQAQLLLERLPLPTLAVIDGPCFGGGFGLAAACDFRIGTPRTRFAVTPARLGLVYSLEDTRRLVRLVGDARARRLLMRGEQLDAGMALAWGVLDSLVEPEALAATAEARAAELAAQSPTAMAGIKATLGWLAGHGLETEAKVRANFEAAFSGADFAEGAAAFMHKRRPRF